MDVGTVLVTNTTNSQQKNAELRETLFVARGLPLDDGSNNLTARATDRAGNYEDYPPSGNHTVSIDTTPSVTYAFDANGNMTSKTVNGSSTTTYQYTPEDQLFRILFPDGKREKFLYDGLGQRIETRYFDGSTTTTRKYVYLGGSVIEELDVKSVVVKEYVRGLDMGGGIGSIIYQKKSSDYYYYHYRPIHFAKVHTTYSSIEAFADGFLYRI